jgi:hypothetical protein
MSEDHRITGEPRGEPLPAGRVGIRVRVPLSGNPSPRWSRDFSARLANELAGHPHVGHLRLNDVVQGDEIVLEGVEQGESAGLADALRRAIEATNRACTSRAEAAANVAQHEADAVAQELRVEPA